MGCCGGVSEVAQTLEFWLLLTTGLTMSLGHCIGMCGPLVTAFALAQREQTAGPLRLALGFLTYHGGRVLGYALIGAAMGAIGSTVFLAGGGRQIQGALSVLVGAAMLLMALGLVGWLPTSRWVENSPVQKVVAGRLGRLLGTRTAAGRLGLGLANGFLPCGPVFAVAMTAAGTASWWKGALAMIAFGLGTVPVLVILGLGVGRLGARARQWFTRLSAALLLLIAAQLVLRGLAAWQKVPHLRFGEFVVW